MNKYKDGFCDSQIAIANELAELNRIKRLVARREYLQAAYRGLFKIYKDDKGVEHQIPPSDEDKESYTKDVKAIAKQFLDHATDKE